MTFYMATCAAHHAHLYVPLKSEEVAEASPALRAKMQLVLEISRADASVNEGNGAHSWCFDS